MYAVANKKITTARLPVELSNKLLITARNKKKRKTDIIIEALEMYFKEEEEHIDSYKLGLPYFGKYSLGDGDLSVTYKQRIKEKIRAKQASYGKPPAPVEMEVSEPCGEYVK